MHILAIPEKAGVHLPSDVHLDRVEEYLEAVGCEVHLTLTNDGRNFPRAGTE